MTNIEHLPSDYDQRRVAYRAMLEQAYAATGTVDAAGRGWKPNASTLACNLLMLTNLKQNTCGRMKPFCTNVPVGIGDTNYAG